MSRFIMGMLLGIIALLAGQVGIWIGDREVPTSVQHVEVLSLKPWPGGEIHVKYTVRRFRSCATRIDRVLYDSNGLRIPLMSHEFPTAPGPIGDDVYVVAVPLPESTAVGLANYRIISSYVCNPIHWIWPIVVRQPDVSFEIKERL